jgi:hypothetical protein
MSDEVLEKVIEVVAGIAERDPKSLGPETRFSDLGFADSEAFEILEALWRHFEISALDYFADMPPYEVSATPAVISSLRNLAPISRRAARLLELYDTRTEDPSLGDLAESMRHGRHVPSTQVHPLNPPRSLRYVLGWTFGLLALALALPVGIAFLPCNPVDASCFRPVDEVAAALLPYTLGLWLLLLSSAVLPGLRAMFGKRGRRHLRRVD